MDEFDLIARYFAPLARGEAGAFGLTDDAAVVVVPESQELVITQDALVAGVHFRVTDAPGDIARKVLRVNLSDLAAMGARPRAYTLSVMFPKTVDEAFVAAFAEGLAADQERYGVTLIGGDTTATPGPMTFSLTATGEVPCGQALRRDGAQVGDRVFVSGTLGDAALGLHREDGFLGERYRLPQPRVALGQRLRGLATAVCDVSDGLVADLAHICEASGVGANVWQEQVPLSEAYREADVGFEMALTGGDDYELLFTVPEGRLGEVERLAEELSLPLTEVGNITKNNGVRVFDGDGHEVALVRRGYSHALGFA